MRRQPLDLARLRDYPLVSVDTETTGLHWYRNAMFGVAVAAYDPQTQTMASRYWDIRERPQVLKALAAELPKCKTVINHSLKFDTHFLRKAGIIVPPDCMECTMVRAALINEHERSFSLDALAKQYVGEGKTDIYGELADLFGGAPSRSVQMKNLHRAPADLVARYATPDPELAIRLWLWQQQEIEKQDLHKVWDLERRLTPVLVDIESNGVRVDEERAQQALGELDKLINSAQRALNKLAGAQVNANSSPQMRGLFGANKREDGKWVTDSGLELIVTEAGNPSIDKDALILLAEKGDKRANHVLTIRKMSKAQQFLKDHIIGHAVNGRVYPNYNQTRGDNELGTGTGRFSIDDPALQQIPARDKDVASIVRACFLPEPGEVWGCADWEQFEFRWFAHYTKDPNILKVYQENPDADYHKIVSDITGIPRNPRFAGDANAKQINLGLVFGMGRGEMAYQMGLEYNVVSDRSGREWKRAGPKAEEIFNKYHSAIPGVRQLLDQAASIAKSRGYVQTIMGRHIRFPGGKFTHKAGGLVFQGTSADCMKQKMVELHPIAKKEGFRMLLSVHDELDFSFPKKGAKRLADAAKRSLECFDGKGCPIECRVPIRSSVALGPNWWEASK